MSFNFKFTCETVLHQNHHYNNYLFTCLPFIKEMKIPIQSFLYQIKVILAILLLKGITVLYSKNTTAKIEITNTKIKIINTKIEIKNTKLLKTSSTTLNKRQRIPNGQSKMENPQKLATQDEDKENKTTTQYVLDTTRHKQSKIT